MNANDKQERIRMEAAMLQMHASCFEMCVTDLSDKELSIAEVNCIEKCGWKFSAAHNHFASVVAKAQRGPKGGAGGVPQPMMKM